MYDVIKYVIGGEMGLDKCKIIKLPKVTDIRGNLTFIEGNEHIPFDIKRVYYLYDVPGGEKRGDMPISHYNNL